jgi:hypothetical protein
MPCSGSSLLLLCRFASVLSDLFALPVSATFSAFAAAGEHGE